MSKHMELWKQCWTLYRKYILSLIEDIIVSEDVEAGSLLVASINEKGEISAAKARNIR